MPRILVALLALGALSLLPVAASADTVTVGSTAGTPSQNVCVATITCTYVPFSGPLVPVLLAPFDGTVTGFSVNTGSASGSVRLRVLRPAGIGMFTGAGTSAAAALSSTGVLSFTTSLPVRKGDVLAIDNDSSALIFATGSGAAFTAYYEPGLADGATGAPTNITTLRLLASATLVSAPPPPPPPPPTGGSGTPAGKPVQCVVPHLRNLTLRQARRALARRHCRLGRVTKAADRHVRRGRIVSQRPAPRRRLAAGTKVNVRFSSGPPKRRR
jgi:hypothetical protein